MGKTDIVLVANSPGELSALVKPVAEKLAQNNTLRLILVLTPCQYSSGKELEYVKTLPGISVIIPAEDYKKWAFLGQPPKGIIFAERGIVLYLGGDLLHAMLVAKKLKFPAYAYVNDTIGWKNFYRKFFVPDQQTFDKFSKKLPPGKISLAGDLMVDSVVQLPKWSPQKNIITFMPGSRDWQIKHMTPIYQRIMEGLKQKRPELIFQIVNSPFEKAMDLTGTKSISFEEAHNSELVITIPGTNTARLAARGIPMLVLFPLDNPEVIPLEGLAHYLGLIPILGAVFKRWLVNFVNRRTNFFALPNQKAGRKIAPEIRGKIDPSAVAEITLALLDDQEKREQISRALIASMGPTGATEKICSFIEIYLEKQF